MTFNILAHESHLITQNILFEPFTISFYENLSLEKKKKDFPRDKIKSRGEDFI